MPVKIPPVKRLQLMFHLLTRPARRVGIIMLIAAATAISTASTGCSMNRHVKIIGLRTKIKNKEEYAWTVGF